MPPGFAESQALPDPTDSDHSVGAGGAGCRCSSDLTNVSFPATVSPGLKPGRKTQMSPYYFQDFLGRRPSNTGSVHDSPFRQK